MSKKFVYMEGGYVHVLPEGTVIWNESEDGNTSQYFDADSTIINDCTIDESYNTAIDPDNETQYLSILESDAAELTLEDLSNLTIDGEDVSSILLLNNNSPPDVIEEKTVEEPKQDNPDMVVFTLEGSDDLYGIQLMQDESGQMQKYQFKFRQTAEGQLEPIPETVTLLPNDEESEALPVEEEVVRNQSNIKEESCFLAMTQTMQPDTAEDVIEHDKASQQIIVKREVGSSDQQNFEDHTSVATTIEYGIPSLVQIKKEHYLETITECDENSYSCDIDIGAVGVSKLERFNQDNVNANKNLKSHNLDVNEGQVFANFMAPSNHVEVGYETEVEVTECLPNIQNEEKNEGQITKEYDPSQDNTSKIPEYNSETVVNQYKGGPSVKPSFENQLIHKEPKNKRQTISNPKYYVVYPEKENLMAVPQSNAIKTHQSINKIPKNMKPNSRSVLRSSVAKNQEKPVAVPVKSAESECDLYLKRFSKNKDAMLAKRFHNFLNRTTIPQAPVRQKRQPRKQEIKPIVERSHEEIIVQEVLVSANGFVESFNRNSDVGPLRVTAIVELSDSDEESTSKSKLKNKTSQKRKFDQNIIEIHSDEESVSHSTRTKGTSHLNPKKLDHPPPRAKRKKLQGKVEPTSELVLKKEVICPYCPKTFPSQNSLNTHIIHHNLENSLKNKTKMNLNTRQSMFAKPEYKHKCEKCQATFKNKILLEKHQCTSKQNSMTCTVCLKQFRDATLLNIHKKSHAKANLIKNTTLTNISPRKSYLKLPSSPKKSPMGSFKCTECPKVCDSESKLSAHLKIHKKFICTFCSGTFTSKVMLDSHVRSNCVKNKRVSYTIKKPSVHTSNKRLSITSAADLSLNQSTLGVKMNCDKCSMKFGTFRSLYTHKVQKHGMSTPDATQLKKPKPKISVCDSRSAHGGVPANPRLQQAFAELRKKLAEAGDLTIK